MYKYYYSSSDAQIYFFSKDSTKFIKIDTTVGIAYNVSQTSTPIYDVSNRTAKFFSIGNTVCNGMLLLAFTDEEYLKACISYVTDLLVTTDYSGGDNIIQNGGEFNVINVTVNRNEFTSSKIGFGKISNKAFKDRALQQKQIKNSEQIVSIGSINSLFDIKIFLNNETLTRASDSKLITIKDVKLVGDSFEINSNTDSYLTNGYKFIFKDIERR